VLVAAAICPATALLVPEVAAGAAGELSDLRAACLEALADLLTRGAEKVEVLASGPAREWPAHPVSLTRLGLPGPPSDERPASLHVGQWLLDQVGWNGPTALRTVDGARPAAEGAARVAVLALADGSARRSTAAPGHLDPDAEAYDNALARAVAAVDTTALLALDGEDDARLLTSGRPALQALARSSEAAGGEWSGRLLWSGDPYGVGYLVATWAR